MKLFIIALEDEISKTVVNISKQKIIKGKKIYIIDKNNILIFSDVGVVNASQALMIALMEFPKINHVINLGTSGSVDVNVLPGDIVIAKKIQFLDVDLTKFGYELNQFPRSRKLFLTNELLNEKINKFYDNKRKIFLGTIGTSNSFISNDNKDKFPDLRNCLAIDMEAAAIAMICNNLKIEFNSIKVISDSIFTKQASEMEFKENLEKAKFEVVRIFKQLI